MRCLAVLLAVFAVVPAWGQADRSYPFRPGFVIHAEGDTLRGFVEDRLALDHARLVNFRASDDAEPRTFYPRSTLGFGFADGSRFVSRTVRPEPDASPRAAFVLVLVDGPRSLYAHAHAPGEDRYYIEGEGFPIEGLHRIKEEVYQNGRYVHRTQSLYAGTLTRAFQDCDRARNAVPNVRYTARSLAQAVIDYNRCIDPSYTPATTRTDAGRGRFAFHPGLRVGLGASSLRWQHGHLSTDPQPYVGAFAEVELLNVAPRFSFTFDLSYRRTTTGRIRLFVLGPDVFGDVGLYTTGVLALGMGMKYERPLPIVSPFVAVQYLSGWIVGPNSESVQDFRNVDRPNSEGGFAIDVGLTRRLYGETHLLLSVRGEWTRLKDELFYIPFGSSYYGRRSAGVTLGLRF